MCLRDRKKHLLNQGGLTGFRSSGSAPWMHLRIPECLRQWVWSGSRQLVFLKFPDDADAPNPGTTLRITGLEGWEASVRNYRRTGSKKRVCVRARSCVHVIHQHRKVLERYIPNRSTRNFWKWDVGCWGIHFLLYTFLYSFCIVYIIAFVF